MLLALPNKFPEHLNNINHSYNIEFPRVEAGSKTSTVALRVVGGDEKETQCLGA
jgi:hypothetical protein